jgi:hypothetical protein
MATGGSGEQAELEHRRRRLAAQLGRCGGLIRGSLVVNRRRCGKPQCRCAEGELHESLAFTFKSRGRSRLVHVPGTLEGVARQAAQAYATLRRVVEELSEVNVSLLKRTVKGPGRRKG